MNGIIQGEFGFITADGVYHVTVYATDENGNFRILSMKNIKVSPREYISVFRWRQTETRQELWKQIGECAITQKYVFFS